LAPYWICRVADTTTVCDHRDVLALPKHWQCGALDRGTRRALQESSPIWSLGLLRHCCLSWLLEASDNTFANAARPGAERGDMPNVNMPSDALLDAGDLASVAGPAVSTSGVVTTGSTLNHYRASCQTAPLTAKYRSRCMHWPLHRRHAGLQSNLHSTGRRPVHGHVVNRPAHKHSACSHQTGGHEEPLEHRSQHVACCRAFVGGGGEGEHSTAGWQDKSRRLRLGRAGEELRHIRHLARGATAHDSLRIRTTPCNFTTARTSCAPAP